MNLQSMTIVGHEPAAIMAALRRHFTVQTRRIAGAQYRIEASDDDGRIRLRIAYFWVPSMWRWVYNIQPGDRP